MPYEIWRALTVQPKLQSLEKNNPEVFNKIIQKLNLLAISHEDFVTGEPDKLRAFSINNIIIVYHVSHRLKIIELVDIRELS